LVLVLPDGEVDGQAKRAAGFSEAVGRELDKGFSLRTRKFAV
jgi:hypothetical protein